MLQFISSYASSFLIAINFILWFLYFKKFPLKEINRIAVYYFIIFLCIYTLWNISSSIGNRISNSTGIVIWLFYWTTISIFELVFIINFIFNLNQIHRKYHDLLIIIITLISIPVILASLLCWANKSYNAINIADFYNMILLMIGSITILRFLLMSPKFLDNIESFFIFSGFTLYFSLHILAGNVLSINFLKNFNFVTMANLISQIFWLGSLFFIWKIRSKHSS